MSELKDAHLETSGEPTVLYERRGKVGIVTINRPHRHNAMNDEASDLMDVVMTKAVKDPETIVILITGAGKSFCSGRDVAALGTRARDESDWAFVRRHQDKRLLPMECAKPVIAAVAGYAIGGGCELALSADIRIAADDAIFSLPEINYGILPDTGGSQLATMLAGPSRAKYLVLTGRRIDARKAYEWGLVDELVSRDALMPTALALAEEIASKPPIAVGLGKQNVDQFYAGTVRNGIRQELTSITTLFKSEDYVEARAALREKRKPNFKGK